MRYFALLQDGTSVAFGSKDDLEKVWNVFDEDGVKAELDGRQSGEVKVHMVGPVIATWSAA